MTIIKSILAFILLFLILTLLMAFYLMQYKVAGGHIPTNQELIGTYKAVKASKNSDDDSAEPTEEEKLEESCKNQEQIKSKDIKKLKRKEF